MKLSVLILTIFFAVTLSGAQDFDPGIPPEDQIPLDGGIGLLMAAGAAWGVKKLKEKK